MWATFKKKVFTVYFTILLLFYVLFCLFVFLAMRHVGPQVPDQGSNIHSLHCKAKSQPLDHQASFSTGNLQRGYLNGPQAYEKVIDTITHQGNIHQVHHTFTRMTNRKQNDTKCREECGANGTLPVHCWREGKQMQPSGHLNGKIFNGKHTPTP